MTKDVKKVCDFWVSQVNKYSRRDQMSFSYSCWKNHFNPRFVPSEVLFPRDKGILFKLNWHKGK